MSESKDFQSKAKDFVNNTKDETSSFSTSDIESGKTMAILSYIGFLALVSYFCEKNNKFVVYHAKQGMNLMIVEIVGSTVLSVLTIILWLLWWFTGLLSALFGLAALGLSILGIVNVCNGKAKELPIINKIKIIK